MGRGHVHRHAHGRDAGSANATAVVVAACDEVCWLLNLRAADVQCNPVALAFAVVTADEATLFVDAAKLPSCLEENKKSPSSSSLDSSWRSSWPARAPPRARSP